MRTSGSSADIRVPFLDLRVTDSEELLELTGAVERVLRHGRIVLGPEVEQFEEAVATRVGCRSCRGVNSGSDALLLALKALDIGPGDEVITTSLSWIATANAIRLTGAEPVFADIRDDLNIDPESVARLVSARTKAIVPVHYTGRLCDMDALRRVADSAGAAIVEDAAQAFGAHRDGAAAGSFGVLASFSMNPMKVFAACGEAGAIVTDDGSLADRLESLRYNGTVDRELCVEPSVNARIDTIQAAILLVRLGRLDARLARRREIARRYSEGLDGLVTVPTDEDGHVYYTYTVLADGRDGLREHLARHGVETKVQHPYLMPDQPAYQGWTRGETENARRLQRLFVCLPASEKVTDSQVDYVVSCVERFYR